MKVGRILVHEGIGVITEIRSGVTQPADKLVTHEFTFDQVLDAYEVFGHAAEHNALEVHIH